MSSREPMMTEPAARGNKSRNTPIPVVRAGVKKLSVTSLFILPLLQNRQNGKYQNNYKISKYHVSTFIFYFIQEIMNKSNKFQKKIYIWLYNNKYEFCKYLEICMHYFVKVVFLKVRVLIKLNCCKGVWAWHSWAMLMLRRVILWAADTRLWKFKVWNLRMCM